MQETNVEACAAQGRGRSEKRRGEAVQSKEEQQETGQESVGGGPSREERIQERRFAALHCWRCMHLVKHHACTLLPYLKAFVFGCPLVLTLGGSTWFFPSGNLSVSKNPNF